MRICAKPKGTQGLRILLQTLQGQFMRITHFYLTVTPVLEQMLDTLMQQPNMDVHVKDSELKVTPKRENKIVTKHLVDIFKRIVNMKYYKKPS